jgi:Zn-dependent peptidase ImmA (M78 family)
MVKMVRDGTGRFAERPYFTAEELDRECEQIAATFLSRRRDTIDFPIKTDELSLLIEQHDATLDSSADLSGYGSDVEGMTTFLPDRDPEVSISDRLANDSRRENRLRTTLAHEFGHVHFHRHLWAAKFATGRLFDRHTADNKIICKRDNILGASQADWMEWQAGHVSVAILMPVSRTRRLISDLCEPRGVHAAVAVNSPFALQLIGAVMEAFAVSEEAARIRLLRLGLLAASDRQPSLFG